jgi:hypothetical protein
MPEDEDKSDVHVFIPKCGREIRNWFLFGPIAAVGIFFLIGGRLNGNQGEKIWISALSFLLLPLFRYVVFLICASGAIEVTSEGITNRTRSGKSFSALWLEVNWADQGSADGPIWWTITTSTGHRLSFSDEGLTTQESTILEGLIRRHIPDLPWRKRRWFGPK